jgi:hypothetical protein
VAGLISVADLTARKVTYEDNAQAQAAVDDASAIARACVEPTFDDLEAGATVPAVVVAVVVGMVRRVLTNPSGFAQETLGDYSFATGGGGVATLLPTAREKRLLRKAAAAYAKAQGVTPPAYGSGGVNMQADLPGAATGTLVDPQA